MKLLGSYAAFVDLHASALVLSLQQQQQHQTKWLDKLPEGECDLWLVFTCRCGYNWRFVWSAWGYCVGRVIWMFRLGMCFECLCQWCECLECLVWVGCVWNYLLFSIFCMGYHLILFALKLIHDQFTWSCSY